MLSDLFDLSVTSALQWTRRAGRNWHAYIAATVTAQRHTSQKARASIPSPNGDESTK
jgi:hypothetical protein